MHSCPFISSLRALILLLIIINYLEWTRLYEYLHIAISMITVTNLYFIFISQKTDPCILGAQAQEGN